MNRRECLQKAEKCVCGQRDIDHGKPEDTFGMIGRFWSDYLGVPVTAHDVTIMMVLFKAARIRVGSYVEDNYIDMAGYAACAGEAKGKEVANELNIKVYAEDSKYGTIYGSPAK
ncbi:DUF6378 domain-containing protein [Bacteroides sp.]|uniref:DUF6378 domain-containing protein n=1 Tax=Bacteroides sp. TaxID=29523 RepID=UPI0026281EF1|nr:DUF6378 domain-containing protein [Bacteroides sp.]MDD3041293.1 DUF6378 domain-containing protein [Bacteroides sp.]